MRIEERIRMSVRQIAEEVQPPALDIDLVRRRAQGGRRRRKIGAVAAVAAILAVIVVTPRLAGLASPEPVNQPPASIPAGAVWADADGLHLGNRIVGLPVDTQTPWWRCRSGGWKCSPFTAFALVADGVVYGDQFERVWYQPWTGSARIIGSDPDQKCAGCAVSESGLGPAGDPDGTTAAWFDDTELVMFDTATRTELARSEQPADTLPNPMRENAHGNWILDVTRDTVTWATGSSFYRFDRLAKNTSQTFPSGDLLDVHSGRVALLNNLQVVEVIPHAGEATLRAEPNQLIGPARFNADGRYLAGIDDRDVSQAVVADTQTGEVVIPAPKYYHPTISWGYDDTLMVIQSFEDNNDQLFACSVSERSCQKLTHKGVITLPNG